MKVLTLLIFLFFSQSRESIELRWSNPKKVFSASGGTAIIEESYPSDSVLIILCQDTSKAPYVTSVYKFKISNYKIRLEKVYRGSLNINLFPTIRDLLVHGDMVYLLFYNLEGSPISLKCLQIDLEKGTQEIFTIYEKDGIMFNGFEAEVDKYGNIHCIFNPGNRIPHYRAKIGNTWRDIVVGKFDEEEFRRINIDMPGLVNFDFKIDSLGRFHLVTEQVVGTGIMNSIVYLNSDDSGKTWKNPKILQISMAIPPWDPKIFIDPRGNLHVIWTVSWNPIFKQNLYYSYSPDGEQWSGPTMIVKDFFIVFYDVEFDSKNNLHLIFDSADFAKETKYLYHTYWNGLTWSNPAFLYQGGLPYVNIDKSDNIHIIYSIGGAEIFYTTSARLGSVSLYSEYFTLYQNYPNPFNSYTLIPYDMKVPGYVSLKVYDMMGKLVAVLVDEYKGRGRYFAIFDGSDLPSGVYVYEFRVGSFRRTGKMILAK